jgi:hypothetical protein
MAPQHRIPGARASTAQQKGFASNAYAALTSVENRTVVVSIGMFAVCSIPYLFLFPRDRSLWRVVASSSQPAAAAMVSSLSIERWSNNKHSC